MAHRKRKTAQVKKSLELRIIKKQNENIQLAEEKVKIAQLHSEISKILTRQTQQMCIKIANNKKDIQFLKASLNTVRNRL